MDKEPDSEEKIDVILKSNSKWNIKQGESSLKIRNLMNLWQ